MGIGELLITTKKVSEWDCLLQNTIEPYESAAIEISETERFLGDCNVDLVAT